ncbi:hypothetical protein Tco_1542823 [Tanacetum coccineum]
MNNFADFPKSELLYGQEAQTQMINFTDLPKSDSGYDQKQVKNERLVENVKRGKRVRKRGKGAKKDLACDFERVTVCDCDKRGDRVYCGLGDVVAKEYDCLVGFNDGCDGEGNYWLMMCCADIVNTKVGSFVVPLISHKK